MNSATKNNNSMNENEKQLHDKLRYAIYISGKGRRIKKAIEQSIKFADKVVLVISDNICNSFLKDFFVEHNIEYYVLDFDNIATERNKKNEYLSDFMLKLFQIYNIDYCFSFGNHLLKGKLLEVYKYRIINFHPALLPRYKGMGAFDLMIKNSERFLGNTVHFIDSGIDTGPIIIQNVMLADCLCDNSCDVVLDEQIALLLKVDSLLEEDRINIVGNTVKIKGADYGVSNLYPNV